jgi:hypothetical protein
VLELAFLAVVAAVLGAARVEPAWVVVVMLVAWALVAVVEWAAWRDEPHWASGRPPRYYVPTVSLPARPPTQELPRFSLYPRPREDAPTFIAPPELRDELLAQASAAVVVEDDEEAWSGWPDGHLGEPEADPWTVEELPALPAAEVEPEPEPEPEPELVVPEPEPEPVLPEPEPEPEPVAVAAPAPTPVVLARHQVDPFAEQPVRRWPWQRAGEAPEAVEVPARPQHAPVGGRR